MRRFFYILICPFLINTNIVYCQKKVDLDIDNICTFNGKPIENDLYSFESSNEARVIAKRIVDEIGLKINFDIFASNVPNAVARIEKDSLGNIVRSILYSQNFINQIKNETNSYWPAIGILAHEIAHHLNGHTLNKGGSRPILELEADEFAGFILQKMGATLKQAKSMFTNSLMYTPYDSKTHPATNTRIEALVVGYQKAKEKNNISNNNLTEEIKFEKIGFVKLRGATKDNKLVDLADIVVTMNTKEVIGNIKVTFSLENGISSIKPYRSVNFINSNKTLKKEMSFRVDPPMYEVFFINEYYENIPSAVFDVYLDNKLIKTEKFKLKKN